MTKNNIIFAICLTIVGGGLGFYFFFYDSGTDPVLTSTNGLASDAELSFISLVGQIDPITFDTSLLSDPRFISRNDIRTAIVPEPAGRRDPFAPLDR